MSVQRLIIVFPVSFPQSEPHTEANNTPDISFDTRIENSSEVLFRVVDIWQDRRQPDDCRDSAFLHLHEYLDPPLRVADTRLDDPAEVIIVCGECHLDHAFSLTIYFIKQIYVLQYPVRLRLDGGTEPVLQNDFQTLPGQAQFLFAVHVRVRHSAGPYHTLFSL